MTTTPHKDRSRTKAAQHLAAASALGLAIVALTILAAPTASAMKVGCATTYHDTVYTYDSPYATGMYGKPDYETWHRKDCLVAVGEGPYFLCLDYTEYSYEYGYNDDEGYWEDGSQTGGWCNGLSTSTAEKFT